MGDMTERDATATEALLRRALQALHDTAERNTDATEAEADLIAEIEAHLSVTEFRTEVQSLADRLWALRGDYQAKGDGRPEAPSSTLSAAIIASVASWLACLADDGDLVDEALQALEVNLREDVMRAKGGRYP